MGLFQKKKTINDYLDSSKKKSFSSRLYELFNTGNINKEELLEELLVLLIESDMGVDCAQSVIDELKKRMTGKNYRDSGEVRTILGELLMKRYSGEHYEPKDEKNQLIMMVGVNGSGKTTTISKLIHYYRNCGKTVGVIAADTFRAGAVAQIENWAEKLSVHCVSGTENADPSSVLVDGCRYYRDNPVDIIIADTAGRLQNKVNLMKELEKMVRVTKREIGCEDIQIWLVMDATTGQNGLMQAEAFVQSSALSGVVLSKMDGTSKGGIVLSVNMKYHLPIQFMTYGENIEAIEPFDIGRYIMSLIRE